MTRYHPPACHRACPAAKDVKVHQQCAQPLCSGPTHRFIHQFGHYLDCVVPECAILRPRTASLTNWAQAESLAQSRPQANVANARKVHDTGDLCCGIMAGVGLMKGRGAQLRRVIIDFLACTMQAGAPVHCGGRASTPLQHAPETAQPAQRSRDNETLGLTR